MGLPVTIPGATTNNLPLFSKRQGKLAVGQLSTQINRSAVNPNAAPALSPGADTIYAGIPGLLIGIGGVDTLGSARDLIQFQYSRHSGARINPAFGAGTPMGGASISFAAAGNLTLSGSAQVVLASAHANVTASVAGSTGTIATVFGAAMPGSIVTFEQGQPAASPPRAADVSVGGGMPDLLLGWSFGRHGVTLELGGGQVAGPNKGAQPRDSTDVRITGLLAFNPVEITLPKQG